jgi:hypothetical protein
LYRSILSQAQQAAQTPYQAYQGQQVAGFTPDQLQAMQTVAGAQGSYQPALATAMQYGTQAGQAITPSQIQAAMNPYTQNVVQSTMDVMNQQQAQAMSQLRGTEAQQGAFGGTRAAVAESNLAAQQERSKDQIVAGLMQQGYSNAVAQAQADRAAAGTGAGLMSGLAGQAANLPLSQAQAELGTGALQQQLAQQQLNVPYQQFLQAQAYPYQQLSWLAGLGTGVGSQLGGTSTSGGTTTTTPAQPSLLSQITGGALALGSLGWKPLSADGGRVPHKADGGAVGDGLDIVGTMAKALQLADAAPMADGGAPPIPAFVQQPQMQEPGSDIIQGALKMASAMRQGAKALGGGVSNMADGGVPGATLGTADIQGRKVFTIFPQTAVHAGKGAPSAPGFVAGSAPKQQDMSETIKGLGSMFKGAGQTIGQPAVIPNSMTSGSGQFLGSAGDPTGGGQVLTPAAYGGAIYKEGGGLAGDADGPIFEMPADQVPTEKQMADWRGVVDFGKAADQDIAMAGQGVPMPRPRPIEASEPLQEQPDLGQATAYAPAVPSIATAPAVQAAQQVAQPAGVGPRPEAMAKAERATSIFEKLTGMELTPEARQGLMAMGLRMMTTPGSFGTAIGAGGMQGMATYAEAQRAQQEQVIKQAQMRRELEQERHNRMIETINLQRQQITPISGYETPDGHPIGMDHRSGRTIDLITQNTVEPDIAIRNMKTAWKPYNNKVTESGDPILINAQGQMMNASTKEILGSGAKIVDVKSGLLNDESRRARAIQLSMGDIKSAYAGFGYGDNINKKNVYDDAIKYLVNQGGMSVEQAAKYLSEQNQEWNARGTGINAEARTAGTREANLSIILKATDAAIPAALEASKIVGRTGITPINEILEKGRIVTSDPDMIRFGMANLQLAEHWARAMNPTGVMRESDRDLALKYLRTALGQNAYEAAVDQLKKQIEREKSAVSGFRKQNGSDAQLGKENAITYDQSKSAIEKQVAGSNANAPSTAAPPAITAKAAHAVTTVKNPPPHGAVGTRKDTQGDSWYLDKNGNPIGRVQ